MNDAAGHDSGGLSLEKLRCILEVTRDASAEEIKRTLSGQRVYLGLRPV